MMRFVNLATSRSFNYRAASWLQRGSENHHTDEEQAQNRARWMKYRRTNYSQKEGAWGKGETISREGCRNKVQQGIVACYRHGGKLTVRLAAVKGAQEV